MMREGIMAQRRSENAEINKILQELNRLYFLVSDPSMADEINISDYQILHVGNVAARCCNDIYTTTELLGHSGTTHPRLHVIIDL